MSELLKEKNIRTFKEWQGFVKSIANSEHPNGVAKAMVQCPDHVRGSASPLLGLAVPGPWSKPSPRR